MDGRIPERILSLGYDEWLGAIEDAKTKSSDGGLTTYEWMERLHWSLHRTNEWINKGLGENWLEVVYVQKANRLGIPHTTPAYRLVRTQEKKGQKHA